MTADLCRLLVLIVAAHAAGCTQTSTQFKDQDAAGFGTKQDVSTDAVSVGTGDAGPRDLSLDLRADASPPDDFWVPATDDFVLRDLETGSIWNLRGEAFSGPLAGARLEQVPAFNSFWFAWSVFYNGSEIWNRDQPNATADLQASGGCEVPCDEIRQACGGGKDCIPALDYDGVDGRPVAEMVDASSAGARYLAESDFVFGVYVDGEARAYPHNIFWWHEIYNDRIGDREFSVTFCPLTGSGMVFAGSLDTAAVDFGVSGNLYNSNLVMFDRQTDTLWSQMIFSGISGPNAGKRLTLLPVVETTWARWKQMHPDTKVASDDQGYRRDYGAYPYGDYRTDDGNTFRATNPAPDATYPNKDRTLGLPGESQQRAYVMSEMESLGDRVVINDRFEDRPIVVAYEAQHRLAIPFWAEVRGQALTFEGAKAP